MENEDSNNQLNDPEDLDPLNQQDETKEETKLTLKQKIFWYPIFGIILFCSIVLVYLSMTILITTTLPTIIMLFLIIVSQSTLTNYSFQIVLNVLVVFVLFPFFALLLSIIWQMLCSFLQEFWSNVGHMMNVQNIVDRVFDPTTRLWYMVLQLVVIAGVYILIFAAILILLFKNSNWGSYFLAANLIWTVYGILSVIYHSWKSLFFPTVPKPKKSFVVAEKVKKSKWFRLVVPIEVLDPANLRKQEDWIKFINDPECNEFIPSDKKKPMRIPGYIMGCADIVLIILLFLLILYSPTMRNVESFILPILCFLCFPLCVICPLTIPFYNRKKLKDKGSLTLILTVTSVLYIVLLLVLIIFWIIMVVQKDGPVPQIKYIDNSSTKNYVFEDKPAFCSIRLGDYDIIQLSVLNTISQYHTKKQYKNNRTCIIKPGYESAYAETLKYFFSDQFTQKYVHICFEEDLGTSLFYDKSRFEDKPPIFLARGIHDFVSWGAFLEIFFQQFIPSILETIIPLYSFVSSIFSQFITFMIVHMQTIFNATPTSVTISTNVYSQIKSNNFTNAYFVAHSLGSTILKQTALVVPFDGLMFEGLPLYQTAQSDASQADPNYNYTMINSNIISFYSDNSKISGYDPMIKTNINLPNIKGTLSLLNEIDDACMVAALCSTDDRWVPFCQQALNSSGNGVERYNQMIEAAKEYIG